MQFAQFQFLILISYHPHLLTLSHSNLPTPLSLPLRLAEANLWSCLRLVYTSGLWTMITIFTVFCVFSLIDLYVKWFDVIIIWRIGLLDKLVRVSSPILLAPQWIDLLPRNCIYVIQLLFCCHLLLLPTKYLKQN